MSPIMDFLRDVWIRTQKANAGMKRNECGRTQPLFRVGHDHGIKKRSKPKGLRQY